MLGELRALAAVRGWKVVALAGKRAQVPPLRELGIETRFLKTFAKARSTDLDERTVLALDDAGNLRARHLKDALLRAEARGAHVVLLGDPRPMKAIEAERSFYELIDAGMQTAHLWERNMEKPEILHEPTRRSFTGTPSPSLEDARVPGETRDDAERLTAVAKEYARLSTEERNRTILVADSYALSRSFSSAIRDELGFAGQGQKYDTLSQRDATLPELAYARNYRRGEFVRAEADDPTIGLKRGVYYQVEDIRPENLLAVRDKGGPVIVFSPMVHRQLSLHEPLRTELTVGDRIRVTRDDASLGLARGDLFTVAETTPLRISLVDGSRQVELRADQLLHLDHAYAMTRDARLELSGDLVLLDAAAGDRKTRDVHDRVTDRTRDAHEAMGEAARGLRPASHERSSGAELERG